MPLWDPPASGAEFRPPACVWIPLPAEPPEASRSPQISDPSLAQRLTLLLWVGHIPFLTILLFGSRVCLCVREECVCV